jgi:exonuclease III
MFRKYKTLNFGVPSSGSVNAFEFLQGETSERLKGLLTKEDYDGANILDKRFKDGSRKSPLFEWEGLEWIWADPDFSIQKYMDVSMARILKDFAENPELAKQQIKYGKLDIQAAKTGENVDALLQDALEKLVYFDARCAEVIRETMSFPDFVLLHQSAADVVSNTIASIMEELREEPRTVFFLQELNPIVIQTLMINLAGLAFKISYNDDGTTAIISPTTSGTPLEEEEIAFHLRVGDTFLHEEICILRVDFTMLISVHFSSKTKEDAFKENKTPHKNREDQLFVLKMFVKEMTAQGFTVVVGGDFNQRLTEESAGTKKLFPQLATSTTCKERSALQSQFKKINKKDLGSKDCILIFGDNDSEEVVDCRVRSLLKNGKSYCSYAEDEVKANADPSLFYPVRLQYPNFTLHFPDHDLVEVFLK